MRAYKGLTLVELLVVVAVITVMATVLFPVFDRSRAATEDNVCMNNLKQIGKGMLMYAQDWDGSFPPAKGTGYRIPGNEYAYIQWYTLIAEQLGIKYTLGSHVGSTPELFICPQMDIKAKNQLQKYQCIAYRYSQGCTPYIMNYAASTPTWDMSLCGTVALADIVKPAGLAVVGERDTTSSTDPGYGFDWPRERTGSQTRLAINIHGAGSNYLFADGHVEQVLVKRDKEFDYMFVNMKK